MDLATALRDGAARGAIKGLNVALLNDGRWQASRQNPDGSFAIRVDADLALAIFMAVTAWSTALSLTDVSAMTTDKPAPDIFS